MDNIITTVYPTDAFGEKIGGIESCVKAFLECAPPGASLELVGISTQKNRIKTGCWHELKLNGRKIRFFPVLEERDPNKITPLPLTLRFVLATIKWRRAIGVEGKTLVFHRLEPAFPFLGVKAKKILFSHGDIRYFTNKHCESRWKRMAFLYFWIERFYIRSMNGILSASLSGEGYYKEKYPDMADRTFFVPTSYNGEVFYRKQGLKPEDIAGVYGITARGPRIVFVGRLELPKDPMLLLRVFFEVSHVLPGAGLIIVGSGELEPILRREAEKLAIKEKVFFLGPRRPEEICDILNASDLFVLTSAFEASTSIVVLEALACGVPVVSVEVSDVKKVVKEGVSGKTVSSREPGEIAKAAIEVLKNPPSEESCRQTVAGYSRQGWGKFIFDKITELALL